MLKCPWMRTFEWKININFQTRTFWRRRIFWCVRAFSSSSYLSLCFIWFFGSRFPFAIAGVAASPPGRPVSRFSIQFLLHSCEIWSRSSHVFELVCATADEAFEKCGMFGVYVSVFFFLGFCSPRCPKFLLLSQLSTAPTHSRDSITWSGASYAQTHRQRFYDLCTHDFQNKKRDRGRRWRKKYKYDGVNGEKEKII